MAWYHYLMDKKTGSMLRGRERRRIGSEISDQIQAERLDPRNNPEYAAAGVNLDEMKMPSVAQQMAAAKMQYRTPDQIQDFYGTSYGYNPQPSKGLEGIDINAIIRMLLEGGY